jgi:hypothetical protein
VTGFEIKEVATLAVFDRKFLNCADTETVSFVDKSSSDPIVFISVEHVAKKNHVSEVKTRNVLKNLIHSANTLNSQLIGSTQYFSASSLCEKIFEARFMNGVVTEI